MSHFMLVKAHLPFHYHPGPEAQNSAVRFPFSFAEIVGRFQNPTGVNYFDGLQIYEMQLRC